MPIAGGRQENGNVFHSTNEPTERDGFFILLPSFFLFSSRARDPVLAVLKKNVYLCRRVTPLYIHICGKGIKVK